MESRLQMEIFLADPFPGKHRNCKFSAKHLMLLVNGITTRKKNELKVVRTKAISSLGKACNTFILRLIFRFHFMLDFILGILVTAESIDINSVVTVILYTGPY